MEAHSAPRPATHGAVSAPPRAARRLVTETKQAFKTTEFWAPAGVIVAILAAAASNKGGADDGFAAKQAWLYVAIVASAYIVSRGLAKSGSSEPYGEGRDRSDRDRN